MHSRKGKHLSWVDRLTIERLLLKGYKKSEIAEVIGCCTKTIYNEINRALYIHKKTNRTREMRYNPDGAEARYRNNDTELIKLGTKMLDWMWEIGWDKEYGGMLYFRDVKGLPVQEYWHDMKFWWPHNETIIATLMAYELTGDEKYEQWHQLVHDWTFKHFPDREHGEWYGYLHRDGRISVPLKGNIWKGLFHIPRMYLLAWQTCERIKNK